MGCGSNSGLAHGTSGSPQLTFENNILRELAKEKEKSFIIEYFNGSKNNTIFEHSHYFFSPTGHVTLETISEQREIILKKSVTEIDQELRDHGYETKLRNSIHADSNAKIIAITNSSKKRNITQVQISPGSQRHGNVPYVKISTTDIGIIKIIDGDPEDYKTDGKEQATLIFRSNRK